MARSQHQTALKATSGRQPLRTTLYFVLRDRAAKTVTLDRNIFANGQPAAAQPIDLQQIQFDEQDRAVMTLWKCCSDVK
jgi:hypothetical protein